jgi:hypothetical protein
MTSIVIRMIIVSDVATWDLTYDRYSDNLNIFIVQTTGYIQNMYNKCN